jgi:hypothetical protein
MSAPLNEPPYFDMPTQQDPTWEQTGVYVAPTYASLSQNSITDAPASELGWAHDNLGEDDYAPGRASGGDVDRHINTDNVHGPSYGELGPQAYPI